jgi:hypothetical protein
MSLITGMHDALATIDVRTSVPGHNKTHLKLIKKI